MLLRVEQVMPDVVPDHLGHQPGRGAADGCDLASDAPNPGQ